MFSVTAVIAITSSDPFCLSCPLSLTPLILHPPFALLLSYMMAQRNVAQYSRSVGLARQSSGGSGGGSPPPRTNAVFSNANDLKFTDSTFTVVGGDLHNVHYYPEPLKDIRAIFRSIPNFRKIYQDMLSKATAGTGLWLLKSDKFRIWLEPNGDIKIFWGSGMPGAGKTLLATIVIQHLQTLHRHLGVKVCICYVYFRYSERAEMTVRNILEVLVKQTLERHPEFQSLIEECYTQHLCEDTEPTEAQLLDLLRQFTEGVAVTFYILDALDEAPTKIQLVVIKTLASLNVKLFITSRPLKTIEDNFPEAHTFAIVAHAADIDRHIAKGIENNADLQRLLRADPALRDEIFSRIKQNCGGMFLHASLQLDALCECLSAQSVRDTLDTFPPSIEDVYSKTWARITSESRDRASLAKAVLVWVLNASRSMTLDELERAVATSPVTHKYEPGRHVPGTTLLSVCAGLITVEEDSRLVRLVHYTAKATLENLIHEAFPEPHSLLAAVCMTYLAQCGFQNTTISSEREFRTVLEKDPLLTYASEAWAFHARAGLHVEDTKRRTAQFIVNSNAFPAFTNPDRSTIFDVLSPIHILALYGLPFALLKGSSNPNAITDVLQQSALMIASRFGHEHIISALLALSEIQVNLTSSSGWSPLMLAIRYGHEGTVKLLLAHPNIEINLVNNVGWSALMLAASGGHESIVDLLLKTPDIQLNLTSSGGWSAVMMAAIEGHKRIVELLLVRPDIQVNLTSNDGWSALTIAASEGHEGGVKLLLTHPDIRVNLTTSDGWSALMLAASGDHEGIVKLLLAHPDIQLNLKKSGGWSALMIAASEGHESTVKLLLAHPSIQVNLVNNNGWSALMLAAGGGHEGSVNSLLMHSDIHVNLTKSGGWSALTITASEGHEGGVKRLLTHPDIQVNLATSDGWSALMLAASGGHEGIVKLLLRCPNIQVNLTKSGGWSALMIAAGEGHEGIIKLLLIHHDIQVDLVNRDGWSALMMAASEGHKGSIKLLLMHPDIQVNLTKSDGWSSLMLAARYGHEGTVELLLSHPDVQINLANSNGWSALMMAACEGHKGIIKLLLTHPDIQVNLTKSGGWSALTMAAREDQEGVIKLLLAHPDIQVNLPNRSGWSALMLAAMQGHGGTSSLLLTSPDIHVNLVNHDTDTSLKIASQGGHEEVVRLLLAVPDVDTTITKDGHTAESAAQANGHVGIVELFRDFELRKAATASSLNRLATDNDSDADGCDSDEQYFDAEETLGLSSL